MTQKLMPNDMKVRQATDTDWPEVVDCWYGYEKGTNENNTLASGLQNSPGTYTCWGIWENSHLVAVTWVSCQSSNYAHVLPLRSIYRADSLMHAQAIAELWKQISAIYHLHGVMHFQALITDELHNERASLQHVGFAYIASIIRMHLHKPIVQQGTLSGDIQLNPVTRTTLQRFVELLQQCFQDSLDVPELNILNNQDALIAQYDGPRIYSFIVKHDDRPVGVIAVEIEESIGVLKYFGILPESRRTGHATNSLKQLINLLFNTSVHNQMKLAQHDTPTALHTIELRVDARNIPARKLYQQAGFTEFETETMLIYPPLTSPEQQ